MLKLERSYCYRLVASSLRLHIISQHLTSWNGLDIKGALQQFYTWRSVHSSWLVLLSLWKQSSTVVFCGSGGSFLVWENNPGTSWWNHHVIIGLRLHNFYSRSFSNLNNPVWKTWAFNRQGRCGGEPRMGGLCWYWILPLVEVAKLPRQCRLNVCVKGKRQTESKRCDIFQSYSSYNIHFVAQTHYSHQYA